MSDVAEEELEEYSESDRFVLVDPGDYAEAQKIRAIFEAEKECRDIILENQRYTIIAEMALMDRVQHFAVQLWPIIHEAIQGNIISKRDVDIMSRKITYNDILKFVQGEYYDLPEQWFHEKKHETHNPAYKAVKAHYSIVIFNHLSMMKQKLGLGLKMDKIKAPAEV